MRKACIIVTGMVLTLLFTACKQFTADIDEYLSYWSAECFIESASIEAANQTDGTGVASVASERDVTVTLKVQNPKSFRFVLPTASAARNIVHFEHLAQAKPVVDTDYELKQLEGDTLKLIYKAAFLQKYEWGEKDLSSIITLIAQDGRVFKQPYTFRIKANTPPPKPSDVVVVQTRTMPARYVLCLSVSPSEMSVLVNGERLHKDVSAIEINGASFPLTIDTVNNNFVKPPVPQFVNDTDVEPLPEAGSPSVPPSGPGRWILYYDTGIQTGGTSRAYAVNLKDEKGLVSPTLTATTLNEPPQADITVTAGERGTGTGSTTSDPVIIKGAATVPEGQLTITNIAAGAVVHCTVTDTDSMTTAQYNANPAIVPLGLGGGTEKLYKVDYYTTANGFKPAQVKTKYYKVIKQHTVTFNANSGTYADSSTEKTVRVLHNTTVTAPAASLSKTGYTFSNSWCTEPTCVTPWSLATPITGDITLYAKWAPSNSTPYRVEHYQENLADDNYPTVPTDTESQTGTTGQNAAYNPETYTGFTYQSGLTEINGTQQPSGTIDAGGTTVVKLYYKRNRYDVNFSVDGSGGSISATTVMGGSVTSTNQVTVKHSGSVTFTASPDTANGYEVENWTGATATPPNSTTATLSNVTAPVTVMVKFKKKPYEVRFKVEGGIGGSLKGEYNGTPAQTETTTGSTVKTLTVSYGGNVTFTAQPSARYAVRSWTVSSGNFTSGGTGDKITATLSNITENKTVTVTFFENTINGGPGGWEKLKKAVQEAPPDGTIIIDGTISATNAPDNNGEIVIDKNLTVKKADSVIPAVLDANKEEGGKPKHRIFKVISGKQLTLENLMLKGGMATGTSESDGGGAIYAQSATVKITGCNLTDNEASANGGAIYAQSATVKITGCGLTNNKAELNGGAVYATKENDAAAAEVTISHSEIKRNTVNITSGFGGGIYINDNCKLTLDNTKIIENNAARGGGMRVNNSTTKMTTCTIQENEAKGTTAIDGGGGVYIHRGTLTMTDNCRILSNVVKGHALGGGMIIEGAIVTMKDCAIRGNKADTKGGGVWLKYGAFTMQGSTTVTLHTGAGQNDVYLSNDKMITVDSTLNPTGGTAARITPETYSPGRQVLDGSAIGSNYNKFTVTPNGGQTWSVGSDGKLKTP